MNEKTEKMVHSRNNLIVTARSGILVFVPEPTQEAYETLYALYEQQGLSETEIDELFSH